MGGTRRKYMVWHLRLPARGEQLTRWAKVLEILKAHGQSRHFSVSTAVFPSALELT